MRMSLSLLVAALFLMFNGFACASSSAISAKIQKAVAKYICFDMYWQSGADGYRMGKQATFDWRSGQNGFIVRSLNLMQGPGKGGKIMPMDLTFLGVFRNHRAFVTTILSTSAYQVSLKYPQQLGEQPRVTNYSQSGQFNLPVPVNCIPKIAKIGPAKRAVVTALKKALKADFEARNKVMPGMYADNLKVYVVNFNLDFPYTYVYIPSTGEIETMDLPQGKDIAGFSGFEVGQLSDFANARRDPEMVKQILAHSYVINLKLHVLKRSE